MNFDSREPVPVGSGLILFVSCVQTALGTIKPLIEWVPGFFPYGKSIEFDYPHSASYIRICRSLLIFPFKPLENSAEKSYKHSYIYLLPFLDYFFPIPYISPSCQFCPLPSLLSFTLEQCRWILFEISPGRKTTIEHISLAVCCFSLTFLPRSASSVTWRK